MHAKVHTSQLHFQAPTSAFFSQNLHFSLIFEGYFLNTRFLIDNSLGTLKISILRPLSFDLQKFWCFRKVFEDSLYMTKLLISCCYWQFVSWCDGLWLGSFVVILLKSSWSLLDVISCLSLNLGRFQVVTFFSCPSPIPMVPTSDQLLVPYAL